MNCRIKTLFVILFFLVGCQGYDDQEPIQRTAAQGVVAMDEDELELELGFTEEELFQQQVSPTGSSNPEPTAELGSWSASGVLISKDPSAAVQLQVNFSKSGAYTLQFSIDAPVLPGIGDVIAIAEVDWKVEGNWVHRTINVRSGTALSGTAEGCRVTIRDRSPNAAGLEYRVSVQIATGTRPATSQPPLYSPYVATQIVPSPASRVFNIPQNCGVTSVWFSACSRPAMTPPAVPVLGKVIGIIESTVELLGIIDLTAPQWVPVPAGATRIEVWNSTGEEIWLPAPVYGIEG